MKYFVIFFVLLIGFSVISIENAFAEEEILVFVENDVRKVYYTGENITSAFFDKEGAVIFETGNNAKLTVKAPQVYTYGGQLFVLRNGEEVIPEIETDDCFYYVTFQTQFPEKIELLFAHWPEATEVRENCETFKVSPLKQMKLGIHTSNIVCKEDFEFVTKYNGSPACVKPETKQKLIQRGWTTFTPIQPQIGKSGSFSLDYNNSTYDIRYSIEGAILNSIQKEKKTSYLNIQLDPTHNGYLSIIIPKELIGNKTLGWDGDFVVIIDRSEVDFSNENPDEIYNTLVIPITATSKLVQIVAMYPLSG